MVNWRSSWGLKGHGLTSSHRTSMNSNENPVWDMSCCLMNIKATGKGFFGVSFCCCWWWRVLQPVARRKISQGEGKKLIQFSSKYQHLLQSCWWNWVLKTPQNPQAATRFLKRREQVLSRLSRRAGLNKRCTNGPKYRKQDLKDS